MSANNQILIKQKGDLWFIEDVDVESGGGFGIVEEGFETLEEAVKIANEYLFENDVEYGLRIVFKN